jgi:predicted small secreted protein
MLKKRSFLIISTVALLVLLLSGCSADTANGKIEYDHVAMPKETDPYYIIGFADYVFIGSTLSDGISFTLSSGNKRLEYDISVSECLKGSLAKVIKAVYPAYYENDGTLVLMECETMKDDGLPEKGKNYIFVGTAQPDGSIFLESLYAKTEYNDDNYQRFIDYVVNETSVDRERFISSFEIASD